MCKMQSLEVPDSVEESAQEDDAVFQFSCYRIVSFNNYYDTVALKTLF